FYRMLFFAESPETPLPDGAAPYTAFSVAVRTERLVDISASDEKALFALTDYTATQALADRVRGADGQGIKSRSVRCPRRGATYTWLACRVFTESREKTHQ